MDESILSTDGTDCFESVAVPGTTRSYWHRVRRSNAAHHCRDHCGPRASIPSKVSAQDELAALREQIEQQQDALERSMREQDALSQRLGALEQATISKADASAVADTGGATPSREPESYQRDSVGDLNAESVRAGEFPGSILIPGENPVSLRIGGFVKAVTISDSRAENAGAALLPAYLGTTGDDSDGDFSIDSTSSRLQFDAPSSTSIGDFRGYLEFDLNNSNNGSNSYRTRLAYGSWSNARGGFTAG